jgi:hypothetical protein
MAPVQPKTNQHRQDNDANYSVEQGLASAFQPVSYTVKNFTCGIAKFIVLQFARALLVVLCHLFLSRKFP